MRNIFAKKQPVVEQPKIVIEQTKPQSLIEEIHLTFMTEVDRLLEMAKQTKSLDTQKQDLIDKCKRLKSLGFTSTKEILEAEEEIRRLDGIKKENNEKKELIEAINYYNTKYPVYKFITEESVKQICEKYNLVYGEVSKYIGTVPNENLKQMEEFKISAQDECYRKVYRGDNMVSEYMNAYRYDSQRTTGELSRYFRWEKCPLEIVAPLQDFNMKEQEIKNFKLVQKKVQIPDPIVLKPVVFASKRFFLIVTAWGQEASDILVVNEKMN